MHSHLWWIPVSSLIISIVNHQIMQMQFVAETTRTIHLRSKGSKRRRASQQISHQGPSSWSHICRCNYIGGSSCGGPFKSPQIHIIIIPDLGSSSNLIWAILCLHGFRLLLHLLSSDLPQLKLREHGTRFIASLVD